MFWIVAATALLFILTYLVYRRAFYAPDEKQNDIYNIPRDEQYEPYRARMLSLIDDLTERPFEEATIRSFDGLRLYGRYYHRADGAPLDIAVHGYRGTAERDMCGGIQLSWATGHNVLLIDQRAHGKSEGHTISFGIRERFDCCAWVDWAVQRFGGEVRILLYGVSMGAASVLMASELLEGENVRGIIADSPYSSPKEIIEKVCGDEGYPPRLAYPLAAFAAWVFGGFRLNKTTAAAAVQKSSIPVLILHGEDDRFVPAAMSAQIAAARTDAVRCTFPGAAHGMSAIVHTESYHAAVLRFIERCCPYERKREERE